MENQLLTDKELSNLNRTLPKWDLIDSKLERTFTFSSFIEAFGFMTKVAILSESIGHHPDWSNSYSFIKIKLSSHDLGGISQFDIKLAKKINELENSI